MQTRRRAKGKEILRNLKKPILVATLFFLVDQISKQVVANTMKWGQSVAIIDSFFRLTYLHNPNVAFGMAFGGGVLYILLSCLALSFMVIMMIKARGKGKTPILLALILGGALGNLADRIRMGRVVDFLDFGIGKYRWPVFNIADLAVTIGVAFLILALLKGRSSF